MTFRIAVYIYLVILAVGLSPAEAGDLLKSPVDVDRQRAAFSSIPVAGEQCPVAVGMPQIAPSNNIYSDTKGSVIDQENEKRLQDALAPIRASEEAIAHALTAFVQAGPDIAPRFADCILVHLLKFARDGAMLGTKNGRGTGIVRLMATGPIFAYSILSKYYQIQMTERQPIEDWIRKLTELIIISRREAPYNNNIDYWGAAALASAAVALQDRSLLMRAIDEVRHAADGIAANGTLPNEMGRGDRALEYSLFATQAIATVMAVAEANNDLSIRGFNNGAVLRMMQTMARSIVRPETFVQLSGNPATVSKQYVYQQNIAWVALARKFIVDPNLDILYCMYSPLYAFRAGGEWSVLFGPSRGCRN